MALSSVQACPYVGEENCQVIQPQVVQIQV